MNNKTVIIKFKEKIQNMSYFFYYSGCLREVNFSNFDTSEMNDMSAVDVAGMVKYSGLISLDLSILDTRNVKYMKYAFFSCRGLKEVNLKNFDSNNVETMDFMFHRCESIESLDLSSFECNALKEVSYMFSTCGNLKKIDLRNFAGDQLVNIYKIFNGLPDSGIFVYNSLVMNSSILDSLPLTWNKTDVKV